MTSQRKPSQDSKLTSYLILDNSRARTKANAGQSDSSEDELKKEIAKFREKRFSSGVFLKAKFASEKKVKSGEKVESRKGKDVKLLNEVQNIGLESEINDLNDLNFAEAHIKITYGDIYMHFLKSGHPWARFWAQLKIGAVVIPKSEYYYYIESVLEMDISEDEHDHGMGWMREAFMEKYGFASEQEVDEFLMCELEMAELMPVDEGGGVQLIS